MTMTVVVTETMAPRAQEQLTLMAECENECERSGVKSLPSKKEL